MTPRQMLARFFGLRSQRLLDDSTRVEPDLASPLDLIAVPVPDETPSTPVPALMLAPSFGGPSVAHQQPGRGPSATHPKPGRNSDQPLAVLPAAEHAERLVDWLHDADPMAALTGDVLACEVIEAYHEMCAEQGLVPASWNRVSPLFKAHGQIAERYVWHLLPGNTAKSRLKMFTIPTSRVPRGADVVPRAEYPHAEVRRAA